MSISFLVGNHRVRFAGKTDVGRVRNYNEDDLLVPKEVPIGVISDGMGGHACGEVASEITVKTIEEFYCHTDKGAARTWPFRLDQLEAERSRMVTSIKLANSLIFEQAEADEEKKGMGCTVDAIFFAGARAYIGHVGDSRVYRVREGRLTQLTEDHSLLNDYRNMKEMTPEEIENFPHKNVVVKALGLGERVAVDVIVEEFRVGDIYLLCSDGLSDMISDDEILELVNEKSARLDTTCEALIAAANEAGGKDNITAMLVQVIEA